MSMIKLRYTTRCQPIASPPPISMILGHNIQLEQTAYWLPCHIFLSLFYFITQDQIPRVRTAHSVLGSSTSTIYYENAPPSCLDDSMIEINFSLTK